LIIQLYRYGLPTAVMAAVLLLTEITPLFWLPICLNSRAAILVTFSNFHC